MDKFKRIILSILTIGLYVAGIYYAYNTINFENLGRASFTLLTVCGLLMLVGITINTLKAFILARTLSVQINWKEWYWLGLATTYINYFVPGRAGTLYRATYLSKNYEVSLKNNLALVALNVGSTFLSAAVMLQILSGILNLFEQQATLKFFLDLVSIALVLGIFCLIGYSYQSRNKLSQIHARSMITIAVSVTSLSFIFICTAAFRLCLVALAIDFELPYETSLAANAITYSSSIITITPGNIGVNELIIHSVIKASSITQEHLLSIVIMDRAIVTLTTLFSGLLGVHVNKKHARDHNNV